jgi:hypothetical protein
MSSPLPIILLDNWRVAVVDAIEGIVVLDVTANTEAEAKGRARTAAETHLNCKNVQNAIAKRHTEMPMKWLRSDVNAKIH